MDEDALGEDDVPALLRETMDQLERSLDSGGGEKVRSISLAWIRATAQAHPEVVGAVIPLLLTVCTNALRTPDTATAQHCFDVLAHLLQTLEACASRTVVRAFAGDLVQILTANAKPTSRPFPRTSALLKHQDTAPVFPTFPIAPAIQRMALSGVVLPISSSCDSPTFAEAARLLALPHIWSSTDGRSPENLLHQFAAARPARPPHLLIPTSYFLARRIRESAPQDAPSLGSCTEALAQLVVAAPKAAAAVFAHLVSEAPEKLSAHLSDHTQVLDALSKALCSLLSSPERPSPITPQLATQIATMFLLPAAASSRENAKALAPAVAAVLLGEEVQTYTQPAGNPQKRRKLANLNPQSSLRHALLSRILLGVGCGSPVLEALAPITIILDHARLSSDDSLLCSWRDALRDVPVVARDQRLDPFRASLLLDTVKCLSRRLPPPVHRLHSILTQIVLLQPPSAAERPLLNEIEECLEEISNEMKVGQDSSKWLDLCTSLLSDESISSDFGFLHTFAARTLVVIAREADPKIVSAATSIALQSLQLLSDLKKPSDVRLASTLLRVWLLNSTTLPARIWNKIYCSWLGLVSDPLSLDQTLLLSSLLVTRPNGADLSECTYLISRELWNMNPDWNSDELLLAASNLRLSKKPKSKGTANSASTWDSAEQKDLIFNTFMEEVFSDLEGPRVRDVRKSVKALGRISQSPKLDDRCVAAGIDLLIHMLSFDGPDDPLPGLWAYEQLVTLGMDDDKTPRSTNLKRIIYSKINFIIPLALNRLLTSENSVLDLSSLLHIDPTNLWKEVKRLALPTLVKRCDFESIEKTAQKCELPVRQVIGDHLPEVVSSALLSSSYSKLVPKIEELSGRTFPELVWVKGNGIARVLVAELGMDHNRERSARRAIRLAAQHLSETGESGSSTSTGEFLSRHFLYIVDGLSQIILRRGPLENRKRALRSFMHLLEISKGNLHLYVPKTMALLKLALEDSSSPSLRGLIIDAWCCFIACLGAKRGGPHLAGIVAVLNPHLPSTAGQQLCQAIDGIIAGGVTRMPTDHLLDVVFVPPRPDSVHKNLESIMKRVDDSVARRKYEVDADLERFAYIASKHESRIVRWAGLRAFHCVLKGKEQLIRSLRECFSPFLQTLVLSLSKICSEEDHMLRKESLICLGEIGAVNPSFLSLKTASTETPINFSFPDLYTSGPLPLAVAILSEYIVPALRRGEKQVEGNQNFLGFSIQELLKVCCCNDQTPDLVNKLKPGELSLATSDMDGADGEDSNIIGAKLWASLSPDTQEAAIPYLKAELFVAKSKPGPLRELHRHVTTTSDWVVELAARLIDHLGKKSARNQILSASRGVVRNDFRTAKFLLPYVVSMAAEQDNVTKQKDMTKFIVSELLDGLAAGGESAHIVFYVWDAISSLTGVRKLPNDPLNSLVSLYGTSKGGLPLESLAVAARKVKSYPRAVLFMEQLIRTSGDKSHLRGLLEVFGAMGYSDGVAGVTAIRKVVDTQSQLMDFEASENYEDAIVLYEYLLRDTPNTRDVQHGFLRCLRAGAQWDHLLHFVNLAEKTDSALGEDILAYGAEAAWRLGEWEHLDALNLARQRLPDKTGVGWLDNFQFELGSMLNALRLETESNFQSALRKAQVSLVLPAVSADVQGYEDLYPAIIQMQCIAEVQDAFRVKTEKLDFSGLVMQDYSRISIVKPTMEFVEPILAVRAATLEILQRRTESASVHLEIAKVARKAGNFRAAACAITRAERLASQNFLVDHAKLFKARGQNQRAVAYLLRALQNLKEGTESASQHKRVARLELLTGRWLESGRSSSSEVILQHFRQAVELAPHEEKPLYTLGRYYDKLLRAAEKSEIEKPGANLPVGARAIPMAPAVMSSESGASVSPEEYAPHVVSNFAAALQCGQRYFYESLPRLLTLWFDYGGQSVEITKCVRAFFRGLPKHLFIPVLPQMLSRLLHQDSDTKVLLVATLVEILAEHPDQAIWFIVPVTRSKDKSRAFTASQVMVTAGKLPGKSALKRRLSAGKELIKELINVCCMNAQKQKKMVASRDLPRLRELVRTSTTILIPTQNVLTISIPPRNAGPGSTVSPLPENPVYFSALEEEVLLMSSLMKPKKIEVLGSDGCGYGFLCKREDSGDMRKDARFMEFVSLVNRAFRQNETSRSRELGVRTYAVLPLNEECGILEWVSNLCPLRNVIGPLHKETGHVTSVGDIRRAYDSKNCSSLEFLQTYLLPKFPPVLHRFFLGKFADPTEWLRARTQFTNSVAVWSMVGYIVGLGDRHAENVSIETTTGSCVHVDFACLFEKGLTLRIPEVVPFRLTPNMVDAFGVTGYEGPFRNACESTIEVLRSNHDALMAVLEAFIHDPLGEWEGKGKDRGLQNTHALRTRKSVEQKLLGVVGSGLPLSVQGQVERLLIEATSQKNLSSLYIWWMCWL